MNGLSLDGQYRLFNSGRSPLETCLELWFNPYRFHAFLNFQRAYRAYCEQQRMAEDMRQAKQDALPMPQLRAKLDDLGRRIEAAKRGG